MAVTKDGRFLIILALVLIPTLAGVALLLTAVFGPSDNGLRCERLQGQGVCQVGQTRFFGLFGNSAFSIPESTIRGAKAVCATDHVGGRPSPNCDVYLILDSGPYREYPVLSYTLIGRADASTKKLNDYFGDKSIPSIEIKESLLTPVLLFGLLPLLTLAVLMRLRRGLRWWRSRSQSSSIQVHL